MHCGHHPSIDWNSLEVKFDQEPVKLEDGSYEAPLSSVTSVGHRTLSGWKDVIGMHVCTAVAAACICGLVVGGVVVGLIKR